MAYLCIIASLPRDRVEQIRVPADVPRLASRVAYASHFIVPASTELRDAMDGGAPLDTETWHPLHGDTWTQAEATKVIDLFQHASTAGEAVVTHLDLTRTGKRKS